MAGMSLIVVALLVVVIAFAIAIARPTVDDSMLPRVNVHVMEKCCPHISHFALQEYPSHMESAGWTPGLTFHAFKYNSSLPNCWQIQNASGSCSHIWKRIHPAAQANVIDASSFCLPTDNRLPDPRFAVYYVESSDKRASFITQPLLKPPQALFESFTLSGWPKPPTHRAVFSRFHPLAFYFWRPMMPLRLISDVRMHVTTRNSPSPECPPAYTLVAGDLNYNFALDPFVYFCVRYADGIIINPLLRLASNDDTFLTKIDVSLQSPGKARLLRDPNETGDCPKKFELMPMSQDFAALISGADSSSGSGHKQAVDDMKATFTKLGLPHDYKLFTGSRQWLQFCIKKEPLVLPRGRVQDASVFVERVYLNYSQIARRSRLGMVFNFDSLDMGKQAPHGRLAEEDDDEEEGQEDDEEGGEDEEEDGEWRGRMVVKS